MKEQPTPFVCHIFVCINDRQGSRKSCADGDNIALYAYLKEEVAKRDWKPRVRVSRSGCLGVCAEGPNVMLYPQGLFFSEVSADDVEGLLDQVESILAMQVPQEVHKV